MISLEYSGEKIGKYYIDFDIDNKIVLEFKVGSYFHLKDYKQIASYLKVNDLQLGILILFSEEGVKYKRILNNSKGFDTNS